SNIGTTFENLLLRQVHGNGTGNQGTAIKVTTPPDCITADKCDASKPSWVRIRNINIETGIPWSGPGRADDWRYGIWLDGQHTNGPLCGQGIRDTWIENVRIYSGEHAEAGIYASAAAGLIVVSSVLNGPGAKILIDGPASGASCPANPPGGSKASASIRL